MSAISKTKKHAHGHERRQVKWAFALIFCIVSYNSYIYCYRYEKYLKFDIAFIFYMYLLFKM